MISSICRCNVSVCRCNVPPAAAMSFALHCNATHHLGVAPFTVVCPTVSTTLDTIYRLLLQWFSSRCSTALEVPHCNAPSFPSARHPLQRISEYQEPHVAISLVLVDCSRCNAARSSPLVPGGSGTGQQQQQRQRWSSPSLATTMMAVQRCGIHRHYRQ